jgi:hypothetical protein
MIARFRGKGDKGGAVATKAEAPAAAPESSNVKVVEPETVVAETAPEATAETAAPETVVAETAAPQTVVAEAEPEATAPDTTVVAETGEADLPLANYDTLTVASLRARLRTLTVPQLEVLINYEKAHEGRDEVIGMFERRVAKVVAGETSSFQAVK